MNKQSLSSIPQPRNVRVGERPSASWANNLVDNLSFLRGPQRIGGLRTNTASGLASMPFAVSLTDPTHAKIKAGTIYLQSIGPFPCSELTRTLTTPSENKVGYIVLVIDDWASAQGYGAFFFEDALPTETYSETYFPLVKLQGRGNFWEVAQILTIGDQHICAPITVTSWQSGAGFRRTGDHPESSFSGTSGFVGATVTIDRGFVMNIA